MQYARGAALALLLLATGCQSPGEALPAGTGSQNPDGQSQGQIQPLPQGQTVEPARGGWDLDEKLPFWDPQAPNADLAQQLNQLARERGWPEYSEPGEPDSPTYLTETDAAINLVVVDNDSLSLTQLRPENHTPFYQGLSTGNLLEESTGTLDNGYHFPPVKDSWLAWKIKPKLTLGKIRSFRYLVAAGDAPSWDATVRYEDDVLTARYTPDPAETNVTVPLDATTRAWSVLDGTGRQLATKLTWAQVLDWETPAGWPETRMGDAILKPEQEGGETGDVTFIPGDPTGVRLVNERGTSTVITMLEYGFHWTDNGRDYLQIRAFKNDRADPE